jgi:hypothetical protein
MKTVTVCGMALLAAAALAGCAAQQQQTSAQSPSRDQARQKELQQMESQGQRNDFDKVRID